MLRRESYVGAFGVALALTMVAFTPAAQARTAPRATAAAYQGLEELLPAQSLALVSLNDGAAIQAAFDESAFGAITAELEPFCGELMAGLQPFIDQGRAEFEREAGLPLETALGALTGGIEIGLIGVDAERGAPRAVVSIRTTGEGDAIHALLTAIQQKSRRPGPQPIDHQGISIKNLGNPPLFYAEHGSNLFLTLFPEDMQQVLDRASASVQAGGSVAATLRQSESYAAVKAMTAGDRTPVARVYANLDGLRELALQQAPPEVQQIVSAAGAMHGKGLGLAITFSGKRLDARFHLYAPVAGDRSGVLGLFQHGAADRSLAALAPASADSFATCRFDLGLLYDRAFALIGKVQPEAVGQATEAVAQIEQQLGFGIRQDFLGALGSDWAVATFPPQDGGFSLGVLSVSLRNAVGFEQVMTKLAEVAGSELRALTIAGHTYRYLPAPLGELGQNPFENMERDPEAAVMSSVAQVLGMAWTVHEGRLFIGDMPHSLADYFDAMAGGETLTENDGWKWASESAPANAQAISYSDPRGSVGGFYNFGIRILKALEPYARQAGVPVDLNRLPRARSITQHLLPGYGALTIDGTGLTLQSTSTLGRIDETAIVVGAIAVGAAIAVPNLLRAREGANEAAALGTMRTLGTQEELFKARQLGTGYGTLTELRNVNLIDRVLATGEKKGYRFHLTVSEDGLAFQAEAHPADGGGSGERFFFVDESGVIRFQYFEPARADSPPIGN